VKGMNEGVPLKAETMEEDKGVHLPTPFPLLENYLNPPNLTPSTPPKKKN